MAQPPTTRLFADPPTDQWRVVMRNGRAAPVIATGHQPTLWHPGVLAKDLAADAIASRLGGRAIHVVVEHNPLPPLALDLPRVLGDRLAVRHVRFDRRPGSDRLPPNRLEPLSAEPLLQSVMAAALQPRQDRDALQESAHALEPIIRAFGNAGDHVHLAAQTAAVLGQLKRPYLNQPMACLPTSELVTPGFVERLLADPVGCARAYNRAAYAYPDAHVRPLHIGYETVEVPLWAQAGGPCTPVYADLGDSRSVQLITHDGKIDLTGPDALRYLRPRAVTLSAIMRSEHCDLFIHGTGGGVYDQVTERWWRDWTGEDLAPMAVVSADLYLGFDVPIATREELARAEWFAHHLPFNLDRFTEPTDGDEAGLVEEKRALLDKMDDDRDSRRRVKAFKRIHAINAELRGRHEQALHEAARRLAAARVGVHNAATAGRRDWCFALYPEHALQGLRRSVDPGFKPA